MTIHQQAHGLIDMLSEESAEAVVQVMLRMLPYDRRPVNMSVQVSEPRQPQSQYHADAAQQTPVQPSADSAKKDGSSFSAQLDSLRTGNSSLSSQLASSPNHDPLLLSLLAAKKQSPIQGADALSEEVDEFNDEMIGFFGSEPGVRIK